jgi:diaminopropionate ammonia-lyase
MLLRNSHRNYPGSLESADRAMFSASGTQQAIEVFRTLPDYATTPLHAVDGLARRMGVASLHLKDEGSRLGMGSFKALGGSYAVMRLVAEEASHHLGRAVSPADLHTPEVRAIAAGMTVACATDGNHGRSVAEGAKLVGANAVIFVHEGVSQQRVHAIRQSGAAVEVVDGVYDDAVAHAVRACRHNGWHLVSDMSWPDYERIPGLIMQGYTALLEEAMAQMPAMPTHVFVQAGVGGLAATVAGYMSERYGSTRPTVVVVEPDRAACLHQSALAGDAIRIGHGEPTVMRMLECYEPSWVAWRILSRCADAFMTIEDRDAVAAMNVLARPLMGDPAVIAGESGGAGVAAALSACADEGSRDLLHIDHASRLLCIITEGATDAASYEALVGSRAVGETVSCGERT